MIRPIITAVALALALGLYFAGYLSPDGLLAALTFAGLPGADALVRALRQRAGAPAEVRILGGAQLLDLVALARRLMAAEHSAVRQAGADLGGLLALLPPVPAEPGAALAPRLPPTSPAEPVDIETALETAFWRYDQERKQSGDERHTWKKYIRAAFDGQIGVAPTPARRSAPPALPPAALLLLLPLLALAPSCASWPAWRSALAACGVQVAPAGVQSGVALALHKGEGWAEALGELVSIYGGCLVKAQVQAHAEGAGSDPPRSQAEAAPLATLLGGELAAAPSAVTRAQAQERAAAWLRGHR